MEIAFKVTTGIIFSGFLVGLLAPACATGIEPDSVNQNTSGKPGGASVGTSSGGDGSGGGSGGDLNITSGVGGSGGGGFGCPTTVSGTVFDPAGKLPLYNVVVYVPSEPLSPISEGASCETCDGNFSGKPIAAAVSDAAGKFSMDVSNVKTTTNVPVVIQVGKWRREITIPSIKACSDTPVDATLTRLPRNKSEGNLPKIAVVRGGSDALECLVRKLGVDDAEFTTDSGDGRVHLYAMAAGTATTGTKQMASGEILSTSDALYGNLAKLKTYDMVMMACMGSDGAIGGRPETEFQNVRTYADEGGRIFGSHYNNQWIWAEEHTPSLPYPSVVKFASGMHGFSDDFVAPGKIDTSFPKGEALRDWLVNVGASSVPGEIPILGGEHTVDTVLHKNAQPWITTTDDKGHANVVQYFSFPTPIDGEVCGRMVFSDLHVASGTGDSGKVAFPGGCKSTELSPQEKALAFMLFDLSSCVQPEDEEVEPPVIF